jgi:cell division protein FtsB
MLRLSEWLRRERLTLILAALVVGLVLNCALAPRGIRDLMALRRLRMELEGQNETRQQRNHELQTEIDLLQTNDRYIEALIRKNLGLVGPNELVYQFAGDSNTSNQR